MVRIFVTSITTPWPQAVFNEQLTNIPEAISSQIKRFVKWEDAHRNLAGKLLLLCGLHEFGVKRSLGDIQYTKYQRPYFSEEQIDFNISHSGDFVLCAISDEGRVGVDVELINENVELDDFRNQFTRDEWNDIMLSSNRADVFYDYWTKKESAIKADGRGLSLSLDKVRATGDCVYVEDKCYWLEKLTIDLNYKSYLASEKRNRSIEMVHVDIETLLHKT